MSEPTPTDLFFELLNMWPGELTEVAQSLYLVAIQEVGVEGANQVLLPMLGTHRFRPMPAEILEVARRDGNDVDVIVRELGELARRWGSYRHEGARDEMSAPARWITLRVGGWMNLCAMDADEMERAVRREASKLSANEWRFGPEAIAALPEESTVLSNVDRAEVEAHLDAIRAALGRSKSTSETAQRRVTAAPRVSGFKTAGESARQVQQDLAGAAQ